MIRLPDREQPCGAGPVANSQSPESQDVITCEETPELWQEPLRQQLSRLTGMIRPIATAGRLRAGLSLETAVDMFWALGSPEVHRLLVQERGWRRAQYWRWLAESSIALLLGTKTGA